MSTYVPIQAISVSAGTTSVNFTGIPQTFTDLVIVANLRGNSTNTATGIRFNSDTATNYSLTGMSGEGASPISYRNTSSDRILAVSGSANWNTNWGTILINVMNYTNTTTTKTVLIRSGVATGETVAHVGLWRKSPVEAITSVTVVAVSGSWGADSTFTLYGIGSGAPKAFGGDRVVTDGTYWYHAFTKSGTFTPSQSITADILVIAGGGGGGYGGAGTGGGGAGGLQSFTTQSLTATPYSCTIGAGGAGGTANNGVQGSNSQFGSLTASVGGGYGGGSYQVAGVVGGNGGSGGGAGAGNNGTSFGQAGGTATSGQGNNGGVSVSSGGGGGGGATQAGGVTASGKGGDGSSSFSSWGSATSTGQNVSGTFWFAGGGGGALYPSTRGFGGNGGGGNSGIYDTNNAISVAGTANTGGGGGGGGYANNTTGSQLGAAGGSGIIIVRYAV